VIARLRRGDRAGFQRVSDGRFGCHCLPSAAPGVPGLGAEPLTRGRQEAPVEPVVDALLDLRALAHAGGRERLGRADEHGRAAFVAVGRRERRKPEQCFEGDLVEPVRTCRELGSERSARGVVVIAEQRRESVVAVGGGD
jgi:hypothetical protein